jgi:RecB family endonuclease NucS
VREGNTLQPTIEAHIHPSLQLFRARLEEAFKRRDFIVFLARCSVYYEGRGASKLGEGDRLIVIKPDGALLVHRPTGYSPVNWQPKSDVLSVEGRDDVVVVRSLRRKPRELLEINVSRVYLLALIHGLKDEAEFIEYLDEKEISDYIAEHPEIIEDGLKILRREKPIEVGYADLVGVDKDGRYVIIEVKRVHAGLDAVRQLNNYVNALKKRNPQARVRGILVAPSISKEALSLLNSLGLEFKQINVQKLFKEIRSSKQVVAPMSHSLLEYLSSASRKSEHGGRER